MEAGAFEAIVLGDKTNLDPELKMRYQMAGIIHILAISGLHISLLGMGLDVYKRQIQWDSGIHKAFWTVDFLYLPIVMMTVGQM